MNSYELSDGTFVATQAEAKSSEQEWSKVDIPTSKPDLLEWINQLRGKTVVVEEAGTASPTAPVPHHVMTEKALVIEEAIWELGTTQVLELLRVLTHRIQELLKQGVDTE